MRSLLKYKCGSNTYLGICYSYSIVSPKTVNISHRNDRASLR
nr:MAG TPA: hypothetical protein [Caudoviricetes sp.]